VVLIENETKIIIGGYDGKLRLYRYNDSKNLKTVEAHKSLVIIYYLMEIYIFLNGKL
jgi:hypothetical protein